MPVALRHVTRSGYGAARTISDVRVACPLPSVTAATATAAADSTVRSRAQVSTAASFVHRHRALWTQLLDPISTSSRISVAVIWPLEEAAIARCVEVGAGQFRANGHPSGPQGVVATEQMQTTTAEAEMFCDQDDLQWFLDAAWRWFFGNDQIDINIGMDEIAVSRSETELVYYEPIIQNLPASQMHSTVQIHQPTSMIQIQNIQFPRYLRTVPLMPIKQCSFDLCSNEFPAANCPAPNLTAPLWVSSGCSFPLFVLLVFTQQISSHRRNPQRFKQFRPRCKASGVLPHQSQRNARVSATAPMSKRSISSQFQQSRPVIWYSSNGGSIKITSNREPMSRKS